jgi:small ligand-binding sensory domain FIST
MKRCNHWHCELLQQLQDIAAGISPKDSILVLQTHQIDIARIDKASGCLIGQEVILEYLKAHPRGIDV